VQFARKYITIFAILLQTSVSHRKAASHPSMRT